jgi:hypothetical protein
VSGGSIRSSPVGGNVRYIRSPELANWPPVDQAEALLDARPSRVLALAEVNS